VSKRLLSLAIHILLGHNPLLLLHSRLMLPALEALVEFNSEFSRIPKAWFKRQVLECVGCTIVVCKLYESNSFALLECYGYNLPKLGAERMKLCLADLKHD
jgi:hypothetical protein